MSPLKCTVKWSAVEINISRPNQQTIAHCVNFNYVICSKKLNTALNKKLTIFNLTSAFKTWIIKSSSIFLNN